MPSKLLPLATIGLLLAAPTLVSAAPTAAVTVRARATLSHQELVENTARGLATPVGIATAAGAACELRCVLANPDADTPDVETLLCELGEVRTVQSGFEMTATWSEAGVTFRPSDSADFDSCR